MDRAIRRAMFIRRGCADTLAIERPIRLRSGQAERSIHLNQIDAQDLFEGGGERLPGECNALSKSV